jgi:hypothetical protein
LLVVDVCVFLIEHLHAFLMAVINSQHQRGETTPIRPDNEALVQRVDIQGATYMLS